MTATGVSVGVPSYLSPEQAKGREIDGWADVYASGCMMFEMLTGRAPCDANKSLEMIFKHVTEPIPDLPEKLSCLQPLLAAMMAKEPGDRLAAKVLLRVLSKLVARSSEVGALNETGVQRLIPNQ